MGSRYVKTDENKKIWFIDAKNLYGWAMFQLLPSDEIKFDKKFELEDILIVCDDSDIGYFVK